MGVYTQTRTKVTRVVSYIHSVGFCIAYSVAQVFLGPQLANKQIKKSAFFMKNILVFPCGSEIALEIYRSLRYSTHFKLIGANSLDDHGKFVFETYIGGVPFVTNPDIIPTLCHIVKEYQIDAIYPAMDSVIACLKNHEAELGCKVIAPAADVTNLCLSKLRTYQTLQGIIPVPHIYTTENVPSFPVFLKPEIGYSAHGTKKVNNRQELLKHLEEEPTCLIMDYLPGEEYTVDCFTNRQRQLLFMGARIRKRISNGISVNTLPYDGDLNEFRNIVEAINSTIPMRGAWFAQFKRDVNGQLVLMEIAARFGGSSSLFRARGVNFASLTLFDAFDYDVSICANNYAVEMDRALDTIFQLGISYNEVFVDYDDCLVMENGEVNPELMAFLWKCINRNVQITLLTKHKTDIHTCLNEHRLKSVFDRIIHIDPKDNKADYIDNTSAIFIDDSFAERKNIAERCNIPVFDVSMIPML